jgi:flagellar hook-associated protein 3 FlgL
MRISTSTFFNRASFTLQQRQNEMSRAQLELSTGSRLHDLGTDPISTRHILSDSQELGAIKSYRSASYTADHMLSSSDGVLSDFTDQLTRVYELAVRFGNDSYNSQDRIVGSQEVQQLQSQLIGMANTKVDGRFIFGGLGNATAPYPTIVTDGGAVAAGTYAAGDIIINGIDIGAVAVAANDGTGTLQTAINAVTNLTGVTASLNAGNALVLTAVDGRNIEITGADPSGLGATGLIAGVNVSNGTFQGDAANLNINVGGNNPIAATLNGGEPFEDGLGGPNTFAVIDNLRLAMGSNNGAAIRAAVADVETALDRVTSAHGRVGNLRVQLDGAQAALDIAEDASRLHIGKEHDTDVVDAVARLRESESGFRTAVMLQTRLEGLSLVNMLS